MLLNNELKITVTNNGKDNSVQLSLNPKYTLNDVMTCIQMVQDSLKESLIEYFEKRGKVTEKQFNKLFKTITLEEIYDNKEK